MRRIFALALLLLAPSARAQEVTASQSYNVAGNGAAQWQGFSPTWLSGATIWLRSDLGITIATGVSTWADQTTNGNNPTQATGGHQPGYVAATATASAKLTFVTASSQDLVSSKAAVGATGWTIAQVAQYNIGCNTTACYGAAFGTATNGNAFKINTAPLRDLTARGVVDRNDGVPTQAIESWIGTNDGTTTKLYINGVAQSLTNSTTNAVSSGAAVTIGADETGGTFLSGSMYEVVAWQRVLDAGEIWRLATYEGNAFR